MKENPLTIIPTSNYTPPKLPTLQAAKTNPTILKKLPSRWQKNATVIACIGIIGTITLASCTRSHYENWLHHGGAGGAPFYVAYPTEQETYGNNNGERYEPWPHNGGDGGAPFYVVCPTEQEVENIIETPEQLAARLAEAELELRVHWGGSGSSPFYVVHITEQEILGFIQAKLESAGLDLSATPPENIVETWGSSHGLDLYDAQRRVAVAHLSWLDSTQPFSSWGSAFAGEIRDKFAKEMGYTPVGVFYTHGTTLSWEPWFSEGYTHDMEELEPPPSELIEEARVQLIENVTAQVQTFIEWLQSEGII